MNEASPLVPSESWRESDRSSSHRVSYRLSTILHHLSGSERDTALEKPGVGHAAFLIRDAVLGEAENPAAGAYDPYDNLESAWRNEISVVCRRICANRWFLYSMRICVWTMLVLTFVEPPHWCRNTEGHATDGCDVLLYKMGSPVGGDDQTEVQYYPNSQSMFLSVSQSRVVEWVCLAFVWIFSLCRLGRDGLSIQIFFRRSTAQTSRLVHSVSMLALTAGLVTHRSLFNPYFRLLLVMAFERGTHREVKVLINIIPEVFRILTLVFVILVFYAWFGTVMFLDTAQGEAGFQSLIEAMWTLWICITTANYPDVMMPSYNENRWTALYFVSFMILTFFYLMNIVLASVVNAYDGAAAARLEEHSAFATASLTKAFQLMDYKRSGRIDRDTVMALFCILNEDFPEFRSLSDEDTKLLFAILDKDGSSTITEEEFMDFGSVLLLEFVRASEYSTFIELRFPKFAESESYKKFCRIVKSARFEYAIDCVLFLNAVVIAIQTYPELSGSSVVIDERFWDGSIDTVWELMEAVFTVIYSVECIAKLAAFGSKAYFENQRNVFDFTITVLAVVSSAVVYYPNDFSDSRLIRMIVMARVLRLLRLLTAMQSFQMIGMVSAEIIPDASNVILILFFLMYFFSTLGMHLYGGQITRDPGNPLAYLLVGTDFADNDYWANNFNDIFSGLNVLFNLLVVNNWTECEVGFEVSWVPG